MSTPLLDQLLRKQERKALEADTSKYTRKAQIIFAQLQPMQRRMAEDRAKRIALLTPGRNGKTWTVRARLFHTALTKRNANCLYIGLTREKAKDEIWNGESGLLALADKLGLVEGEDIFFNRQSLVIEIPALGSTIRVGGADNMSSIESYRGGVGYDEVWIDETKSYPAALLRELIEEVLMPRVLWRSGTLGICGTPGNLLDGLFYDITRDGSDKSIPFGEESPSDLIWSLHKWSLKDNQIRLPGQTNSAWDRALAYQKAQNWTDKNPTWMREYLGQWCANDTDYVYRFRPHVDGKEWNLWTPKEKTQENPFGLFEHILQPNGTRIPLRWQFGIGMDLGESDFTAIECFAFCPQLPGRLYQVKEIIKRFKDDTEAGVVTSRVDYIGESLKMLIERIAKYDEYPMVMVADMAHSGEAILTEVLIKYQLTVKKAAKLGEKNGSIEVVNGDLIDGRMKLLKGSLLASQMGQLQRDATGRKENAKQHNDACDAALYLRTELATMMNLEAPFIAPPKTKDEMALEAVMRALGTQEARDQFSDYTETSGYDPDQTW